jgi:CRISPR-associated endonuclease/helicase Cas3
LASTLAWLEQHAHSPDGDLIAYLIAAHHGKVRLSIRSLPTEALPPEPGVRFARGIWDGDSLPGVELGDGERSKPMTLHLEMMDLGSQNGQASWLARVLRLRDEFGPFRLSFLESLLRVADWRSSSEGGSSHVR